MSGARSSPWETEAECYDLNLKGFTDWYADEYYQFSEAGAGSVNMELEKIPWVRVAVTVEKGVDASQSFGSLDMGVCGGGGAGGGIRFKIISQQASGSGYDITAFWDVADDRDLPNPEDVWGFGWEFTAGIDNTDGENRSELQFAIDHVFIGFGEIGVARRDSLSIAMLDREIEKWILDRHCHSWNRAGHLADVLLDSLKYSTKSRSATLSDYNPELRLNQMLPVNEYGVEWQYVINEIQCSVGSQGTKQVVKMGTPRPDPDTLFEFYQVQLQSMQTAGEGKTVHDWVANTQCWSTCERFCEFACLSDYSSDWRRGGQVCQTSRELTCRNCESVTELNPCVSACLKYSEIAVIVQRPPSERSAVETTLLSAGGLTKAVVPATKPIAEPRLCETRMEVWCRTRVEII